MATAIIVPITTKGRDYSNRVNCLFEGKEGQIVLEQVCAVDKERLCKKLGTVNTDTQKEVLAVLMELFTE